MKSGGRRDAEKVEDRREEVDGSCRSTKLQRRLDARPAEQERNPQCRLVDEIAVDRFAVLTKTLAMIRRDDERCVLAQSQAVESGVDPSHQLIRPGHLAVVGSINIAGRVGLGRLVGVVRIVEMHHTKNGPLPA